MSKVKNAKIEGLFGYADHDIEFNLNDVTILTAPNGAGKTHILKLVSAALSLDYFTLLRHPYKSLQIELENDTGLRVSRSSTDTGASITILALKDGDPWGSELTVSEDMIEALNDKFPSHVVRTGPGRWYNKRIGRSVSDNYIETRYGINVQQSLYGLPEHGELGEVCSGPPPVLIDTKRLDSSRDEKYLQSESRHLNVRDHQGAEARIREYTQELNQQVNEARRNSIRATQSADASFAARALEVATMTIKETELRRRYNETVDRYEKLSKNALAVGERPLDFPESTTPTVRRILRVFLDDWDKRLEPLIPLNNKIQTLRSILDSRLSPSGKMTGMSARGNLEFKTKSGRRIAVVQLSSGEQHLVALFTMLLFSAQVGSLVLIDEPEISLHASWKHALLDDLEQVAAVSGLQIVVATHSSAIINGNWDLVEEVELVPAPDAYYDGTGVDDEEEVDDGE